MGRRSHWSYGSGLRLDRPGRQSEHTGIQFEAGGCQWNALGTSALNVNVPGSGTRAGFAAVASDGTNPAVCWTEEINSTQDRRTINTTPQLQCKSWNGSQ